MSRIVQNGGTSASVHTLRIYKLQKRVSYFQRPQIFIESFLPVLQETGSYMVKENKTSVDFFEYCTLCQRESHY